MQKFRRTLAAFALLLSPAAFADVITCYQTEPLITEEFNTDTGIAKITDAVGEPNNPRVIEGIRLIVTGPATFEIQTALGAVLRSLTVNYQGQDGMSDFVYPIYGGEGVNGPIGCVSTRLRRLSPE